MTLSTEKLRSASKRFTLVRMSPRREITKTLTLVSGSDYRTSVPPNVYALYRNGVVLTRVTTLTANDQWTRNTATNDVTVRLASAPDSQTNIVTADYYIYLTSDVGVYFNSDPDNLATDVVLWEPYLVNPPSVRQSSENIFAGKFSIAASSVEIENSSGWMNPLLSTDDNYFRRPVEFWYCISTPNTRRKIFTGRTRIATSSGTKVTVDMLDPFSDLQNPYYGGDSFDLAFLTPDTEWGVFPLNYPKSLSPQSLLKPIPLVWGKSSKGEFSPVPNVSVDTYALVPESMNKATCIDFVPSITSSNNRQWVACRVGPSGVQVNSIVSGGISSISESVHSPTGHTVTISGMSYDLDLGATVRLSQTSKPTNLYHVVNINSGEITLLCRDTTTLPAYTIPGVTATVYPKVEVVVVDRRDGTIKYLYHSRDFGVSETTLPSGNKVVRIGLSNSFEFTGTPLMSDYIDPEQVDVYYLVRPVETGFRQGAAVKKILDDVGLQTNAASFTSVDAFYSVFPLMQFPEEENKEYETGLAYAEKLVSSAFCGLFLNSSGEAQYYRIREPLTTGLRITDELIIGDVQVTIDSSDIITRIEGSNPQEAVADPSDVTTTNGLTSLDTAEALRAQYLIGISRPLKVRHHVNTYGLQAQTILQARNRPFITYTFSVATLAAEVNLFDSVTLVSKSVVNSSGEVNLLVVGIEFTENAVTITGTSIDGVNFSSGNY